MIKNKLKAILSIALAWMLLMPNIFLTVLLRHRDIRKISYIPTALFKNNISVLTDGGKNHFKTKISHNNQKYTLLDYEFLY